MKLQKTRIVLLCACAVLFLVPFLNARGASLQDAAAPPAKQESSSPLAAGQESKERDALQSLSRDSEKLQALPPMLAHKDKMTGFTRETLEVQWRAGDPIHLYVLLPEGVERPPVVLYLYSYPSETDRFRDDDYCRRVTQGGVAAVGFVSALTGHRYHDLPGRQWFVSELPFALIASVHDVQMILDYLAQRGDVDMDRVGMFGQGSGGTIAVLAAAIDKRIKAIDVVNPWGDWPDWMAQSARVPDAERPNYVTKEFLTSVAPLDPVKWLPTLKSRAVRIVDAMDDPMTPIVSKRQIEAAAPAPSAQVKEYQETNTMYQELSGGKLFQWIKEQLRFDAARQQLADQRP